MFELFVLGLILVGLVAISRAPIPRHQTENQTQPIPTLRAARTDWNQFHKPTYLRRDVVLDSVQVSPTPPTEKRCFHPGHTNSPANEEAP